MEFKKLRNQKAKQGTTENWDFAQAIAYNMLRDFKDPYYVEAILSLALKIINIEIVKLQKDKEKLENRWSG